MIWLDSLFLRAGLWRTVLWHTSEWPLFPFPARSPRDFFLLCSLWEPDKAPQDKTDKKTCRLHWGLKLSDLYTLGLWQFNSYSLVFPALVLVPEEVSLGVSALMSCGSLYLPVCASNLGGGGSSLPCELISLMELRRIDFSVCLAFYLLNDEPLSFWYAGLETFS